MKQPPKESSPEQLIARVARRAILRPDGPPPATTTTHRAPPTALPALGRAGLLAPLLPASIGGRQLSAGRWLRLLRLLARTGEDPGTALRVALHGLATHQAAAWLSADAAPAPGVVHQRAQPTTPAGAATLTAAGLGAATAPTGAGHAAAQSRPLRAWVTDLVTGKKLATCAVAAQPSPAQQATPPRPLHFVQVPGAGSADLFLLALPAPLSSAATTATASTPALQGLSLVPAPALQITPSRRPPRAPHNCSYADLRWLPPAEPATDAASRKRELPLQRPGAAGALQAQIQILRLGVCLGTFDALFSHILGTLGHFPGNRTDALLGRIGAAIEMLDHSLQRVAPRLHPLTATPQPAASPPPAADPPAADPPATSNPPPHALLPHLAAQEAAEHTLALFRELSPLLPSSSPAIRRLAAELALVLHDNAGRQEERRALGSTLRNAADPPLPQPETGTHTHA